MDALVNSSFDGKHEEYLKRFGDIPFENSHTQTLSVIDSSLTPERAYRTLGLRFFKRLQDLKGASIQRRKSMIEVKILERDMSSESNGLERELLSLEIEEKQAGWDYENKLAKDCISELSMLSGIIDKMPSINREQFEESDKEWIAMKLNGVDRLPVAEAISKGAFTTKSMKALG